MLVTNFENVEIRVMPTVGDLGQPLTCLVIDDGAVLDGNRVVDSRHRFVLPLDADAAKVIGTLLCGGNPTSLLVPEKPKLVLPR